MAEPEPLVVTAIEAQKRHPKRCNVFVNGAFWAGLDAEVVMRLGIRTGRVVERNFLETVVQAEERLAAQQYAVNYILRYGSRSTAQLRERLQRRGYTAEVTGHVLEWLQAQGLLDDLRLARTLIDALRAEKLAGPHLVAQRLAQKRVPPGIRKSAMAEAYGSADLTAEALAAARRQIPRIHEPDPRRRRQRLLTFLLRRGFPYPDARAAATTALSEADPARDWSDDGDTEP